MKRDKKQIPFWAATGHRRPVSRREFLATGINTFAASAFIPNWLRLLENKSLASSCPVPAGNMIPFVTLNLAGGASLAGNYVPVDAGGNMLPSYVNMGLGTTPPISTEFGNVPFGGMNGSQLLSQILQGIRNKAQRSTLDKTAFLAFCSQGKDDGSDNQQSVSGLIYKAGLVGSILPNMGSSPTLTGENNQPALVNPPTPLVVRGLTDISNALTYAGSLASLTLSQKIRVTRLMRDLNASQSRRLASEPSGGAIQSLLDCAGIKNEDLLNQGTGTIDPGNNASISTLWGLTTNKTTREYIFSSLAYNALLGQSGPVAMVMGGYDYHDNTRTSGDSGDLAAGQVIGQILESAAILGKPVCLYVNTDGGIISAQSTTPGSPWVSDRGVANVSYLLMYNPSARPATNGFQVGNFTAGQISDDKTPIGSTVELAAQAVLANYLQLNGKISELPNIVGEKAFGSSDLAKVVKVA